MGIKTTMRMVVMLLGLWTTSLPLDAQSFFETNQHCDSCARQLYLKIDALTYIKNNEYFGNFSQGFTGIGFYANSSASYFVSNRISTELGIHLASNAGSKEFSHFYPFFSLGIKLSDKLSFAMGKLRHPYFHGLSEVIFRKDRWYQEPVESGLQLLFRSKRVRSDTWLNWEEFIEFGDSDNERFVFGNTTEFSILSDNFMQVIIPVQLLIAHTGGQINSMSNDPVYSQANAVLGGTLRFGTTNEFIAFEALYHHYRFLGDEARLLSPLDQVDNGAGMLYRISLKSKSISTNLAYWNASDFISPRGEFLYASISEYQNDFFQSTREIIKGELTYTHVFHDALKFKFETDVYYDMGEKRMDYALALYFKFDLNFLLKENFEKR